MALSFSQLDGDTRDRFSSTHWVHLEGVGGTQLITLNGLGGVSTVGWSVHEFSGPSNTLLTDSVPITATIGVFSSGEVLHRIGYSVTLTGSL